MYDTYVSLTDRDPLLPDSKFYSIRGRYVAILLNGYNREHFTSDMVPSDPVSQDIFCDTLKNEKLYFRSGFAEANLHNFVIGLNEVNLFIYIIGFIYFIFGYFPLGVRILNIFLGISSTYFLFKVAKRHFGELTANLFLLIALFLPTQFLYSCTLSRDFLRAFIVSLTLWVIYG